MYTNCKRPTHDFWVSKSGRKIIEILTFLRSPIDFGAWSAAILKWPKIDFIDLWCATYDVLYFHMAPYSTSSCNVMFTKTTKNHQNYDIFINFMIFSCFPHRGIARSSVGDLGLLTHFWILGSRGSQKVVKSMKISSILHHANTSRTYFHCEKVVTIFRARIGRYVTWWPCKMVPKTCFGDLSKHSKVLFCHFWIPCFTHGMLFLVFLDPKNDVFGGHKIVIFQVHVPEALDQKLINFMKIM